MDDDRQLLKRFVDDNSQAAFAALTARYLSLVYATCRRELGDDRALAEDVTQAVFLILARKAPRLRREVVLSGWLFQTARFAAKNARLQETRRQAAELKAVEGVMEQQTVTEDAAWTEIEPLLNQSLAGLRDAERECVLLRFFQGLTFAEAGAALGLSEDAARKRVTRTLEKMRVFFVKNGVVIPSTALAVLLTAHAAKAAPVGLAPTIAQTTLGIVAGHVTTAALTGSHIYQLSEGILKAMKIVQIKVAVGLAAGIVIGSGTYAVAHGMTLTRPKITQVAASTAALPPGHILKPAAGQAMPTTQQVAERCRAAYTALTSYQGTATVNTYALINGTRKGSQTSASIQFARPGKIRTIATTEDGQIFTYVSDGIGTEESFPTVLGTSSNWKKEVSTEMAIGSVTGVSQNAGTTIPALLLGTGWGTPQPLGAGGGVDAEVREDTVDGKACYMITGHGAGTTFLWIDEKTYLLHRLVRDTESAARTIPVNGKPYFLPAIKMHNDEHFTHERLNQPIPESTFTLPPVQ